MNFDIAATAFLAFFVAAFGLISYKKGSFDKGGLISGLVVVYAILFSGGWKSAIMILAFVTVSSALTRLGYKRKVEMGAAEPKGGIRGWQNVLANGGVPVVISIFGLFAPGFEGGSGLFSFAYLGSLAAATSDTIATEIGVLYRGSTRLITRPKKQVPPGTSGGVTPLGFLVALVSSSYIGGVGYLIAFHGNSPSILLVAILGGMVGSTADSLIGATLQRLGRCQVCGSTTEEAKHHGRPVELVRGVRIMGNNVVNVIATIMGAVSSAILAL